MNKVLENLIERVAALPREAQEEVVRSVIEIEQRHAGVYHLDEEERADILEALDEIKRGDVATDDEAAALFKRLRG
jgi:ParB-like chromosome segregation protein Spo0J